MIKSNFREWNLDRIEECFGLEQVKELPLLTEMLNFPYEILPTQRELLRDLQEVFSLGGDDWNETELENKIISPTIVLSKIDNRLFSYFLERELSATINEYELSGKVDGMIATGFRSPKKPYFCLNEYKKGTDPNGDPKGQALIAMLVAQQLNGNEKPIFGCFVIGRDWYFMLLEGTKYAISTDYSYANDSIFDIFRILKGLRFQIDKIINS